MGFCLTQFSLKSVVSHGSIHRGGVSVAVQPVNFTRAAVATLLAFKGTHPRQGARTLRERHIVDGDAPVKSGADRFKYQLGIGGQRSERVSWTGQKIMFINHLVTISLAIWFSITGTQKPNSTLLSSIFPTYFHNCFNMNGEF